MLGADLGWSSLDGGLRRSLEAERKFEPQSRSPAPGQVGAHSRHSTNKASKGTNSLPGEAGVTSRVTLAGKVWGLALGVGLESGKSEPSRPSAPALPAQESPKELSRSERLPRVCIHPRTQAPSPQV